MRSTWGTSQGEDKLGARDRILNTKVARRACAGQTFPLGPLAWLSWLFCKWPKWPQSTAADTVGLGLSHGCRSLLESVVRPFSLCENNSCVRTTRGVVAANVGIGNLAVVFSGGLWRAPFACDWGLGMAFQGCWVLSCHFCSSLQYTALVHLHRYGCCDSGLLCCLYLFTVHANSTLFRATRGGVSVIFGALTFVLARGRVAQGMDHTPVAAPTVQCQEMQPTTDG